MLYLVVNILLAIALARLCIAITIIYIEKHITCAITMGIFLATFTMPTIAATSTIARSTIAKPTSIPIATSTIAMLTSIPIATSIIDTPTSMPIATSTSMLIATSTIAKF